MTDKKRLLQICLAVVAVIAVLVGAFVGCSTAQENAEKASSIYAEISSKRDDTSVETSVQGHRGHKNPETEASASEGTTDENVSSESEDMSDVTHGEYESSPGETSQETSEPDTSMPEVHECSFIAEKTVSPTCTNKGYTVYKCSCGVSENRDYVDELGHEEGEWTVITEATTTSTGLKRKICTRCGVTLQEDTIDKLVEDPDAKYNVPDTMDNVKLLEERTLYYLNQYRLQDGVQEATALLNGKTYTYAKMRAEQLVDNFAHDMDDIYEVATQLEFGHYVAPFPESYYDFETGEVVYTGEMTEAYYSPGCSEAITKGYSNYSTVDGVAKEIARICYNSDAHWSYVGATTTKHITIGAYLNAGTHWYVCIATSGSDEYD